MKTRGLFFLIFVVAGSLTGAVSARPEDRPPALAQGRETREPGPRLMIEFRANLLSVRIHNAPWDQVVKELARRTGVTIEVMGSLAGTVTQEFEALPLQEGLARVFDDADFVFSAAGKGQQATSANRSMRVWVYPKNRGGGEQAHPPAPGQMLVAQAQAPEAEAQLGAVDPAETASEAPAEEQVIEEEQPGTEIEVGEEAPGPEVEIVGEEEPEPDQAFPGLMANAPAEAPAEEAVIRQELPGTEIWVRDEAPVSEVEIVGEE